MRPATPLSIILLAAFALLLLSVLSTPIIPGIHLAAYNDVTFGVFGFCTSGQCSGYAIGYNTGTSLPSVVGIMENGAGGGGVWRDLEGR